MVNINPNKRFLYKVIMLVVSNLKCFKIKFLIKQNENAGLYNTIPGKG